MVVRAIEDRFWSKVDKGERCWIWTGYRCNSGYGRMTFEQDGRIVTWLAHRLAWKFENGSIGEGAVIRHKCHNRACVNPAHLEDGTQADNMEDYSIRKKPRQLELDLKHEW